MSDPGDDSGGDDAQVGVATKTRAKPKKPSQFKVLLLNDDYTPMEFVVMVLKRFFSFSTSELLSLDFDAAPSFFNVS